MNPYYQDDSVTIYHGDCREILPALEPDAISLVIADPPYGMDLETTRLTSWGARKWTERVRGDAEPFDPSHLFRFRRLVIFGANHFASRLPESNGWIVWNKRGDGRPSGIHFGDCELAWSNVGQGIRMFSNAWHGAPRWHAEPPLHPTQKPVVLMRWLIENHTKSGDLVLDPYMGSGPVPRAAKDLGRKAIGIEIEERYCEIAAKRMGQEVLAVKE